MDVFIEKFTIYSPYITGLGKMDKVRIRFLLKLNEIVTREHERREFEIMYGNFGKSER